MIEDYSHCKCGFVRQLAMNKLCLGFGFRDSRVWSTWSALLVSPIL